MSNLSKEVSVEFTHEDGILICVFGEDAVGYDEAVAIVAARKEASGYKPTPVLVDITRTSEFNKEARAYFSEPEGTELILASAIIVGSAFTTMMANFYLRVNFKKAKTPVRLFTNYDDAKAWLQQYKPK